MDSSKVKTRKDEFLNSSLSNFRYESGQLINEYRLFHCLPDGSNRFSLYFGPYQKKDDTPFLLRVHLSNVDVSPEEIMVQATFSGRTVTHSAINSANTDEQRVAEKICQILNYHKIP